MTKKLADWGVTSTRKIFAKLFKFKNLGRVFKQVIVLWNNRPFLKPHWNGEENCSKNGGCFGKIWLQKLQKLADWGVTSSRKIFAKLFKFKSLGRVFKQVIVLWNNWPFLKSHWNQNKLITHHHLLLMYNWQRLERGWTENITTNWTHYFLWLIIKIKKKIQCINH